MLLEGRMTFSSKTYYSKAINEQFDKYVYVMIKCFAEENTRNQVKRKHDKPLENHWEHIGQTDN